MEMIILGEKINTEEIDSIWDIERDKKMFLNREAGFIVKFKNGSTKCFKEDIPYESYPSEIAKIKIKWNNIQKQLEIIVQNGLGEDDLRNDITYPR